MNPVTKIFLLAAVLVLGASAPASAQAEAQGASQTTMSADKTNAGLASGAAFHASLNSSLDSKKSKPGDAVAAHTTENVKSQDKTVMPKGTKLVGHVTKASARAKGDPESELALVFDRAVLKNGEEVPLHVAIQAMAAEQPAASAPDSDLGAMGSSGSSAAGPGMSGGRGAVGGATSAAGSTTGTVTNAAGAAGGTVNSTAGTATGVAGSSRGAVGGLDSAGQITSNSRGVFSMDGLNLNSAASNGTEGSVITSAGKNVHLDSGTRMLMVTQATASAAPRP